MSTAMHDLPRRHRITVETFYRMDAAGLFGPEERVELVNGEIIDVPAMGSRHAATIYELAELLTSAIGKRAIVRQQLPLRLNEDSEPLPDIAVVLPHADNYKTRHPTGADALLVVEVSDATLRFDRDVKTALYAACGVPEAWVVDIPANRVHLFRDLANGAYTFIQARPFGPLTLAALPGAEVDLSALDR